MLKIPIEILETDKHLITELISIIQELDLDCKHLLGQAERQIKLLKEEYYV